ncbi:uncharacterized protein LOC132934666 [Metopolophium dirhodum]|uniref:uncharacterized protein LOC132934666 n=1 Tax=Metopolophium dirhodum TaxID=44670 RepID=UPI00298FEA5C|nr:uncharacterized protein LOC132934666 [Metopolophium dirhodum]
MLTTTKRATIIALWLVCCYYDQAATNEHDHVRTKSSTRLQKTQDLTSGMPLMTVVAGTATVSGERSSDTDTDADVDTDTDPDADADTDTDTDTDTNTLAIIKSPNVNTGSGGLRDFLFGKPNKIFKSLMRTSVRVVQRGMNAFQGVSNKVYHVARKQIGVKRASGSSSTSAGKSDESGDGDRTPAKRQAVAEKKPTGFVKRVAKMLDTGIAGIEQVTDLGVLLGNIGTHKILSKLDGKSGNQEIFKMLIKFVGSKVGKGAKGSVTQFINDVGTVSTFAATDDEVTNSISTIMERFMGNPKVSAAMVRLVLTVLDGSPSTSCLLDQLPLSPQDVRMAFDVFVGSNGQMMLKTIAGLVSDLTTGPDTKAFLESALGMMSMFKSDTSVPADAGKPEKPTTIVGSLANFFMGNDENEEGDIKDDTTENTTPPPMINNRKRGSSADVNKNVSKPSAKTTAKRKPNDDDWFSKTETTIESSKKKAKSKSDDWFETSLAKSTNSKVHRRENVGNKKNEGSKKEDIDNSDSTGFSDEFETKNSNQ